MFIFTLQMFVAMMARLSVVMVPIRNSEVAAGNKLVEVVSLWPGLDSSHVGISSH